jgi:hypothetical protein
MIEPQLKYAGADYAGRVLDRIVADHEDVLLVFADGTFTAVVDGDWQDRFIPDEVDLDTERVDNALLVQAGVYTPEQLAAHVAARKAKRDALIERSERESLARLKAKYEGTTSGLHDQPGATDPRGL